MNAHSNSGLSTSLISTSAKHGTCWICGYVGPLTDEHRTKKSDLREVFGDIGPGSEVYWHDSKGRTNFRLRSPKANLLMSPGRICAECNNRRTQPHDTSWETLSRALRAEIAPGATTYRAQRAFPYDTRRHLLNVHLYFAKLFGCTVVGENAPLDHAGLARAIMAGKPHPNLFLRFGLGIMFNGERFTGATPVNVLTRQGEQEPFLVHWWYFVRPIGVHVMLTDDARAKSFDAWHPKHGTTRLKICDFEALFHNAETMHRLMHGSRSGTPSRQE